LVAAVLSLGAGTATAQAAPLFDEPTSYEIGAFNDLGVEDWGGPVLDIAVADFDNDGLLDIAGTYQDGGTPSADYDTPAGVEGLVILINEGDGTFAITDYIPYGDTPTNVVSEDFDNDGDSDLVTLNGGADFTVLLNDGTANFTIASRVETNLESEEIAAADFDGDGDIDFAVTVVEISPDNGIQNEPGVQIFLNSGNGDFVLDSSIPTYTPGYTAVADLTTADFDGDGDVDIFAGSRNGIAIYSFLTNDGNGFFSASEVTLFTEGPEGSPEFFSIASGDIDNDDDMDVVATTEGGQTRSVLTLVNDGTGTFVLSQVYNLGASGPTALSDFDDDDDLDIVTQDSYNTFQLLINDGQGSYIQAVDLITLPEGGLSSLSIADLNNDNKNDLVLSSIAQVGILVVFQTGVENPTPTEQAASLIVDVVDLDLPNNLENSYLANLYKVEGFIGSGMTTPATNQLNAFINKVNQDYAQGKITQQVRDDLVLAAQQLIDDLTN
jgi:hypothetical protein